MEKRTLAALFLIVALALLLYTLSPSLYVVTRTVTGTLTLKPCPANPTKNAYALETADGTTYYILDSIGNYLIENRPELKPFWKENLGKTITLQGEIITINGQLHIKSARLVS